MQSQCQPLARRQRIQKDARNTPYPLDATRVNEIERLHRPNGRASKVDLAATSWLSASLRDLELKPVKGAEQLNRRKEKRSDEIDTKRLAASRYALERELKVLLAPGRKLRERFKEPTDRARERDLVRVEATKEDSRSEEKRRSRV